MSRNDDAYKDGYDEGRGGNLLDDLSYSLGRCIQRNEQDKIYDKGYDEGVADRNKNK